jgi:DNA mismatch endonuclease (patch repair protein)
MSRVKGSDTKPEIKVRKLLHKLGYRFRIKYSKLPGKPDIVLPKYKTVIQVNGCFWHGHESCKRAKLPSTNNQFWNTKINSNIERDKKVIKELELLGWKTLTIWQCEINKTDELADTLIKFLNTNQ